MRTEEATARGARTLLTVCLLSFSFQPASQPASQPAYHNSNFYSQIFTHASQNTKCTLFTTTSTLTEGSMTRNERETEKRQAAIIGELRRELNTAKAALNPKRTFSSIFSLSSPNKSGRLTASLPPGLQPVAPPRPPPGASRVNPTKKTRKLETVEFED